jgi:Holliday junction resolvasome RuvABC ATP-dependent DNA helicase subunit
MSRILQVSPERRGAFGTIRDALTAATSGATIVVDPGVYSEVVHVSGGAITIAAADEGVVLDGADSYDPVVVCRDGTLTLRGLTLRAGQTAVRTQSARVELDKCTITGGYGPAVLLADRTEVTINECTISGAQQGIVIEDSAGAVSKSTVTDIGDDGIIIRLGAEITFRDCRITDCGQRGLYAYQSGKPTLEACEISATGAEGVAVAHESSPILRRCHVHDTQGVGISFAVTTSGELNNCKIENTAEPGVLIADGARVEVIEGSAAAGVGATSGSSGDPAKVESLLAELDAMVGLQSVKAEVRAIIDEIQVNEWRRSAGLNVGAVSNHLIFAGAPGTGKTTVARIYGQLLAALGVLSGGPLREVSRRDLVGQYIGHTAEKTATVFDETRGGVLFLDEAYTLSRQAGGGGNDFGQEAIDTIVKMMEDMRNEIAVIAAGYTREMHEFLAANPGLASRFVKTIEFENYSPDELTLIVSRMVDAGDYTLDHDARPLLMQHFSSITRDPHFGNARDARKLFESLRKAQSQRLRQLGRTPSLDELRMLSVADLVAVMGTGKDATSPQHWGPYSGGNRV